MPKGPDKIKQQELILQTLLDLPPQALTQYLVATPTGPLAGWLKLALIIRSRSDPPQRANLVDDWLLNHADLDLDPEWFNQVVNPLTPGAAYPHHIALLLPFGANLAEISNAILRGVLTAYYQLPETAEGKPELRLYDTSGATPIVDLYEQAVAKGAQLVIGPLEKLQVGTLIKAEKVSVPTLLLNMEENREVAALQPLIYQMALAPEDEVEQVLQLAWSQGRQRALLFYPDTAWGQHMRQVFDERWRELGGEFAGQQSYPDQGRDFADLLRKSFQLDRSQARAKALETRLGIPLGFTPRRRQDIDALFLVAFPEQARLLQPQLQFHRAGAIPVYATSHVFTGAINQGSDRDMDGLHFCDAPWVLGNPPNRLTSQAASPNQRGGDSYPRLFALGVDAFRIFPYLQVMQQQGYRSFAGLTGELRLLPGRVLQRTLPCAVFADGIPNTADLLTLHHGNR